MRTKPTSEPVGAPVPAPTRLPDNASPIGPAPPLRRRNPASRLLSSLRGDKHMVGAYPPGEER